MQITRRDVLKSSLLIGAGITFNGLIPASAQACLQPTWVKSKGNPMFPGLGVCDPEVKLYDNQVYLYATHDASPANTRFVMHNWWVWHTYDLVNWELVSILEPEQTYFGKPSSSCWGTDAARRNGKYYFYFSMGPENIGVVEGDSPAGPWHDPLGHALIPKGSVDTEARDPGVLQEPDGTSYIVFGTFQYYIARLDEDMISLAEKPRRIQVINAEGPYGKGKTDDKPFLHRRGNTYYLSWGSYYGMSDSPYGPFDCKGCIIQADHVSPKFGDVSRWQGLDMIPHPSNTKNWLAHARHGTFFELFGQNYFICNDESQPGTTPYFRDSILSYVRYRQNGEIDPIRINSIGVGQYDARRGMYATDFFKVSGAIVEEKPDESFAVRVQRDGAQLVYPNVRNLQKDTSLRIKGSLLQSRELAIEVRRGSAEGHELGKIRVTQESAHQPGDWTVPLRDLKDKDDLCLIFRGGQEELAEIDFLSFA